MKIFFLGIHDIVDAEKVDSKYSFISLSRLLNRQSDIQIQDWVLDAGTYGFYESGKPLLCPYLHALLIERWSRCGNLLAAVSWDWLCSPHILKKTGLTVQESQQATVERYDLLLNYLSMLQCDTYLMPVLQGQEPEEYQAHLRMYSSRLTQNQWVGVGSLKGKTTYEIEQILFAINALRPDLNLHGFGLTPDILKSRLIRDLIYSADSQAWQLANRLVKIDKRFHAINFVEKVKRTEPKQLSIFAKDFD